MPDKYNINLMQKLTGEYAMMIYKNSKKIGEISAGNTQEEARAHAKDIAEAFTSAGITDHTK